jgi:hypothetical protein
VAVRFDAWILITDGPQRHRDTEKPFSKYFSKIALVFMGPTSLIAKDERMPRQPRNAENGKERIGLLCVSVPLWPVRDLIL